MRVYTRGIKDKVRGQESAQQRLQFRPLDSFKNMKEWNLNTDTNPNILICHTSYSKAIK